MSKGMSAKLKEFASDFMAQWAAGKGERPRHDTPHSVTTSRSSEEEGEFAKLLRSSDSKRNNDAVSRARKDSATFLEPNKRVGSSMQSADITSLSSPIGGKLTDETKSSAPAIEIPVPQTVQPSELQSIKVCGVLARAKPHSPLGPVAEVEGGKLAILGLDFGTAFTKAVVRWSGYHHAVDWSDSVEVEDPYLMPSVFCEHKDGSCVLGSRTEAGWKTFDGIKLKLLSVDETPSASDLADAVIFLALAFRHVNTWLRRATSVGKAPMRWRLHVGLPTQSWDDSGTSLSFKTIAQAARLVACESGTISRVSAMNALQRTGSVERPAVDVFPEFACQLYSYLLSSERQDDLHALVDIGAGTMDVAFFNVHSHAGENILPIFSANVDKLGAHYLIAALADEKSAQLVWKDGDASLTDEQISKKTKTPKNEISVRRRKFGARVAKLFNGVRKGAKLVYETSPAFKRGADVRLFLCGGGSRISTFREKFNEIYRESASLCKLNFVLSDLVQPKDLVGNIGSNYDRLSVAYGLSQNAANIGSAMRSSDLQPVRADLHCQTRDRDDDR